MTSIDDEIKELFYETPDNTTEEQDEILIQQAEEKPRKPRHSKPKPTEIYLTPEQLQGIKLTKKQIKEATKKETKERSELQKKAMDLLIEKNKAKAELNRKMKEEAELKKREKLIKIPAHIPKKRTKKPKIEIEYTNNTSDSDSDEIPITFQKKKKSEKVVEIDYKLEQLKKINDTLNSNPYYVASMKRKGLM